MSLERNLLIEAGAGTGKTTRLVKAVLQALFIRQIPLEAVVALTFTNKAAGELKERVGSALEDVLEARTIDALRAKPWWPSPEPQLSLTDLQKLAGEATSVLDRANISTIHSFAFSLLKRFPLAAGIDPQAEIDDKGLRFDDYFRREWPVWLMEELGEKAPREALWMELLSRLALSEVEEAARRLADFEVPLDHLRLSNGTLAPRLKELHAELRTLCAAHPGTQKAGDVAQACEEVIGRAASGSPNGNRKTSEDNGLAARIHQTLTPTKAWPPEDIARLKLFQAIARNLLIGGDRVMALLTEALAPFVERFRQVLLTEGCLTHSALLYLSREIVKNHPEIRAAMKRSIRLILIDEFQDTDPLQAELLLYLAEMDGRHADHWETVTLEHGKLFIVGDPKQSIYRFRGADIAAYERIGKLLVAQGGFQETLEINYRSQSQVIRLVNLAFEQIILAEPEISPPYVAVQSHHPHHPEHPVQDVEIWLADSAEEQSVEDAQATEAEAAARWIKESVGTLTVYDPREGARRPMLYRDVALIFRSYSPMDRYIEALRRHDIPFAVESERYFFTTPEVTDFINLLRAAENPSDLLSLVGYLRGSLGGLTDEEILKRRNAGTLEDAGPVKWLRTVTARLGRQTLAEVLQYIFENTYLLELAARSYHGDQTVANLVKLRRLLEAFAAEGLTTMGLLLKKLEEFFNDDKIEGESPLADENYNAIRLLTIHKAKGLEYPVVFLPSLHSELKAHKPEPFVYDWRSQKMGLTVAGYSNLEKLLLDAQTRRREAAEENRILYVAMTRARERLVLSGGVHLKSNKKKTYLLRLLEAWNLSIDELGTQRVQLGDTSISVRRLEQIKITAESVRAAGDNPLAHVDPAEFAKLWRAREARAKTARATPLLLSPSSMKGWPSTGTPEDEGTPIPRHPQTPTHASHLGTLLHRFLEHWDFTCEKCSMPAMLTRIANTYFAQEGLLVLPLPDPKEGKLKLEENDPMTEIVAIVDEAQKILADFIDSEAYDEIKGSEILGREVPFFYGPNTLMRGAMDILYRLPDGKLIIGDYKTGGTPQDYNFQGEAYRQAVKLATGEESVFKIISLREGSSVESKSRQT